MGEVLKAVDWPSVAFGFSIGGLVFVFVGWRLGSAERRPS